MLNYQAGCKFPFVESKLEIEARMQEFVNAGSIEVSVGPTKVLVDYPRSEENLQISKLENWAPYHHPEKLLQFIIWKIPTNSGDIWSGKLYEILSWKWDSVPKVTPIVVFDTQLVQIPFCHQLQATSPVLVVHYLGAETWCRHSCKKCFCLREPVFWGRIFLILRRNFPNME